MIKLKLSDYFKTQCKLRPEVHQPAQKGVRGLWEELRANDFQAIEYPPQKWNSSFEVQFSGNIYVLTSWHISVILALYDDDTILWLDDHSSDKDFAEFLRRENLLAWLPNQKQKFMELLVETKFSFLGWPRLLIDISNIDRVPDYVKSRPSLENWVQGMLEAEMRIPDVARQIHPPTYTKENEVIELQFYIWTKLFGRIIKLTCFIQGDGLFSYEGIELMNGVGFFTVPR